MWLPCPYLGRDVELTDERIKHIELRHPDFYPRFERTIAETLLLPDLATQHSRNLRVILLLKWYAEIFRGNHVQVGVVRDSERFWIITAFLIKATKEPVIWQRDLA